tara:strand:+ start:526 stop:780 length:255 start_codon:yes stop_codon:yes gene_type:complete
MDEEPDPDDYAPTLDEVIRKALVEGKSIFCETEAVSDFIKLTVPELVCSYDATDFLIYDLLIFSMGYILSKPTKETSEVYWVQL